MCFDAGELEALPADPAAAGTASVNATPGGGTAREPYFPVTRKSIFLTIAAGERGPEGRTLLPGTRPGRPDVAAGDIASEGRLSAFAVGPEPGTAARRIEDQLRIEPGPCLRDAERWPLADELQRASGRQRPHPPAPEAGPGAATPEEGAQDGTVRLGPGSGPPCWPMTLVPSANCVPRRNDRRASPGPGLPGLRIPARPRGRGGTGR